MNLYEVLIGPTVKTSCEVLRQREYGGATASPGPVMVLFYRASKHQPWVADSVLSEWSRFALLVRSSILRVCAYDLDKNQVPKGSGISMAADLTSEARIMFSRCKWCLS